MNKMTKVKGFGSSLTTTKEGGITYKNTLKEELQELFTLGLLNGTFYTKQEDVIANGKKLFERALKECPEYTTKCAIYGSQEGNLKLVPTIWAVYISTLHDKTLFKKSFPKIIRNFNMLYDFMEFCRKGGIRQGLGRGVKETVNKRFIDMINEYHATRSKGTLSEIAKTTRPYSEDEGFQKLMKYVAYGELTFPRAVALKTVIAGLETGIYTTEMDDIVKEHRLQLEELKHSVKELTQEDKQRLYATIYSRLSYSALILNLVALERVFATKTDSVHEYNHARGACIKQIKVLETDIPDNILEMVCNKVSDEKSYFKARMLPFSLINAERMVVTPELKVALGKLLKKVAEKSFNINEDIDVLIGVDTSGSMGSEVVAGLSNVRIATLFGSMLKKAHTNTKVCAVASRCQEVPVRKQDDVFTMAEQIRLTNVQHGTRFETLLQEYNGQKYVILITDNQPADNLERKWIGVAKANNAKLIIWQISQSGHKISCDRSVTYVRGYSDKMITLIRDIIEGKGDQADKIEAIEV